VAGGGPGLVAVTPGVGAYNHHVYLSYRTRHVDSSGGLDPMIAEQLSTSVDDGVTFTTPLELGPEGDVRWAVAGKDAFPSEAAPATPVGNGSKFLGDYTTVAASGRSVYVVWSLPEQPPAGEDYRSTTWVGAITPARAPGDGARSLS
jgi:hypothetical protein